jgi:EmrB/QacA subfamily drug resistance transporter
MTSSDPRRWWAVAAMVPAVLVVGIDATVLSLALPTLAVSLDASTSQLQWFVSVYLLVFAAVLLPAGMLGDRYGRKRLLLAALVILGLSSLACAYADTPEQFMAARAALGVGAAMIVPAALGALPALFSPTERPKAVAAVMAASIVGQPIGPLLGGWLLTSFWWGSVFIINVPVVLVALLTAALLVPESRSHERPRFDPLGIALSSAGLAAVTYGVIRSGQEGWGDRTALAAMALGAGMLAVFVLWERRTAHPLVDIRLFSSPDFSWGTAFATLVSFAMMGLLFAAPLYFQDVVGLDAFGNGLRQLPMIGGLLAGAVVATRLMQTAGARLIVGAGFGFMAAGLVLGSTTSLASGETFAMLWLSLCGLGMGLAIPTTTDAALGALSPEHGGVGSGLIQALRMVGGALGAAVMGSILNSAYRASLELPALPEQVTETVREGVSAGVAVAGAVGSGDLLTAVRLAFLDGMQASLIAAALAAAVSAALALRFMPRRSKAGAAPLQTTRVERDGGVESGHGTVATD